MDLLGFLATSIIIRIQQQADWGHTLVIPFISGYFVWIFGISYLQNLFEELGLD